MSEKSEHTSSSSERSSRSGRKLAAILFADIVGYTAMMEKDEPTARQLLDKFHFTLITHVEDHGGKVINNYGDGCLCTFDSAVDATRCAKEVQLTFQELPRVPVRIGLHSGDVFFEKDNVYGDSVNITSRIESLGTAGAVLFSQSIKKHLANQPGFEIKPLGQFLLKNVEEPLEVFALANSGLAIPSMEALRDQLVKRSKMTQTSIAIAVMLIALAITALWWALIRPSTPSSINDKSIAVLPFEDLSPQKDQEYFSSGVAEEILTALSQLEGLKVAGRLSSFSFKDKNVPISEIGRQLEVSTILNGSIRKNGDQIRVTANLVDARDGFQIWSEVYDEQLKDIFSIQEKIARNIVQKFSLTLSSGSLYLNRQPANLEAYEQYLKGRFYLNKSLDGVVEARQAFENAIQLDTNYALAYEGLAETFFLYSIYGVSNREEAFEQMREAAEKALALDPQAAAAHKWVGSYYCFYAMEWQKGLDYLKQAFLLDKNNETQYRLVFLLLNPSPENKAKATQVQESIVQQDPLSISALLDLNRTYQWTHQYEEIISNAKKIFELDPDQRSNMRHISEAYLFSGQPEKALPYTERMIKKNNYSYFDYVLNLTMLDRPKEAEELFLQKTDSLDALTNAFCYFILDQPGPGFEFLEKARQEADPRLVFYKVWSHFDRIRDYPEFQLFEERMGFPKVLKD